MTRTPEAEALERLERRAASHATLHDIGAAQQVRDDAATIRAALSSPAPSPQLDELTLTAMILAEFGEPVVKHIGWAWEEIKLSRESHRGGIEAWARDFARRILRAAPEGERLDVTPCPHCGSGIAVFTDHEGAIVRTKPLGAEGERVEGWVPNWRGVDIPLGNDITL